MKPTLADRLRHIRESIVSIHRLLDGNSIDVLNDDIARAAFERFLEIVSEATRRIDEEVKEQRKEIPWRRIEDLGNVLRHAYHRVDTEILWSIYTDDLPIFEKSIENLGIDTGSEF